MNTGDSRIQYENLGIHHENTKIGKEEKGPFVL
jgi:hypothetical protein